MQYFTDFISLQINFADNLLMTIFFADKFFDDILLSTKIVFY